MLGGDPRAADRPDSRQSAEREVPVIVFLRIFPDSYTVAPRTTRVLRYACNGPLLMRESPSSVMATAQDGIVRLVRRLEAVDVLHRALRGDLGVVEILELLDHAVGDLFVSHRSADDLDVGRLGLAP